MRKFLPIFLPLLALWAGCQSSPKPAKSSGTDSNQLTSAGVVAVPSSEVPLVPTGVLPERTDAALAARDRLLKSGQQHQVLMQSAFRNAPGFTVANWSGLVLSPKDLRHGVVVGSGYRVLRVEIHPLSDGRLRVWVEVANQSKNVVQPEGACEFRPSPEEKTVKFKLLPAIAAQGTIVVSFESDRPQMEGYSILVRNRR